eukprot:TRINITY_DN9419_c0_g1_i1.p1 TRINITY_DN9419_c0_g1~~TRINITY_DN9419_c0_g1_i1.p1  ORF type:complete len:1082 (+),score=286.83 TRINITY_DN9419_c0_g1_i1:146-3391(+)
MSAFRQPRVDVPRGHQAYFDADTKVDELCATIETQTYGHGTTIATPFGSRPMVYADSTASGRNLKFIESYLSSHVLPMYSNTHSTSSACGLQTVQMVEESRQLIKNCLNGSDDDAIIFAGSGSTAAVQKLATILHLGLFSHSRQGSYVCTFPGCQRRFADEGAVKLHARTHGDGDYAALSWRKETSTTTSGLAMTARPLVLVGPMEHHSNVLIWRESGAEVIEVPADDSLRIDQSALEALLKAHSPKRLVLGSFCMGSNVTGLMEHVSQVTELVHMYGGIVAWDAAAAAPHVAIDLNPSSAQETNAAPDAVFISPHKFPGGPDTPGLLCVKKKLLSNAVPSVPGGGTVFYVTSDHHRYIENSEEREEGGTPNIVGAIRCGMVYQLQAAVGLPNIAQREQQMVQACMQQWGDHPNIVVAGGKSTQDRLPILSLLFKHGADTNKYLHWNYVAALLNDVFGIQARGGCLCAGPYAHRLLGLTPQDARDLEEQLLHKKEVLRPGFVRVSLGYYWSQATLDYVIKAVLWIADHGHKLLPRYMFLSDTGQFLHRSYRNKSPNRMWLHDISYVTGHMTHPQPCHQEGFDSFDDVWKACGQLLEQIKDPGADAAAETIIGLPDELARLCWFSSSTKAAVTNTTTTVHQAGDKLDKADQASSAPMLLQGDQEAMQQWSRTVNLSLSLPTHTATPAEQAETISLLATPTPAAGEDAISNTSAPACPLIMMRGRQQLEEQREERLARALDEPMVEDNHDISDTSDTESDNGDSELLFDVLNDSSDDEAEQVMVKQSFDPRSLKPKVPKALLKPVGMAIREFAMIQEGDRVLVGLSGGKDSLSLLHVLIALQRRSPVKFELGAVTMNPQFPGFDPSPLKPYLKALGIPYFFQSEDLMAVAKETNPSSICSWCSRMKRGILYSTARRNNYNVLALGQHMDDLAESFVMSTFHNGRLRTMKAHYCNQEGDIRIIRPLVFTRERVTRAFAAEAKLPVIQDNCPACFEEPKERYRMKTLLAQQEHLYPLVIKIILRAMKPLMRDHTLIKCVPKDVHDELTRRYGVFVHHNFDKVHNYDIDANEEEGAADDLDGEDEL